MEFSEQQRDIVESAMESGGITGVSAALVKDGEIVAADGFGHRETEGGLPMTAHTITPLASLTKSVTGVGIMQLVEEGLVWLDEPVASYLPGFRVADEEMAAKITPRLLLSHKSGMGRTGHQRRMFAEEQPPYRDRADLVSRLAEAKLQTPPNRAWSYCNEGYVVLGHLTETLRGAPIEECYQRRIFDVAGMRESYTSFPEWRAAQDRSHLYVKNGNGHKEIDLPQDYSVYLPGGGICSTAHDLARYQIAVMDYAGSPLLTAGSLDQMHTVSMPFGDTGWGYGFGWNIGWSGDTKVVAHGGGLAGVSTYSLMVPSKHVGAVVITNLGGARADMIAEELVGTILGAPIFREDPQDSLPFKTRCKTSHTELQQLAGEYAAQTVGRVEVDAADGQLNLISRSDQAPDVAEESTAVPVGKDLIMSREKGTVISFLRDGDGEVTGLLSAGELYQRMSG